MIFKFKTDKPTPRLGQIQILKSFCFIPKIIDGHFIWLENIYVRQDRKKVATSFDYYGRTIFSERWVDVKFSKEQIKLNLLEKERLFYRTKS